MSIRRSFLSKTRRFENAKKQKDAFSKSDYPDGAQLCAKCNDTAVISLMLKLAWLAATLNAVNSKDI